MQIIFFLLFIVFAIFILGISIIGKILRTFFGLGKRANPFSDTHQTKQQEKKEENTYTDPAQRKKIFDKSDGEYVDFEEVEEE